MDVSAVTHVVDRWSSQWVTHLPPVSCIGYFTSPGIDIWQKGPTAFSVSSERHRQSGVNEVAQISKRQHVDSNLGPHD